MTQWTAFVGFTGVVLTGFLALARLSQRVVDDADDRPATGRNAGSRMDPSDDSGTGSSDDPGTGSADESATDPGDESATDSDDGWATGRRDQPAIDRSDQPTRDRRLGTDPAAPDGPVAPTGPLREDAEAPDAAPAMSPGALLANVALTQGLFGALVAAAAWYFAIPASALGLTGGTVDGAAALAVGVGFGVVLWVGNEVATAFADEVGATYDEGLRTMLAPDDARGWALLLGATLPVIALVEEFLFRAAAIGATSAAFGGAWALAVVSSLAFALGHGAQGRVGVVVTGALGFALAAGFVLTRSFLVVVVAHYLVNALEFAVHEGVGLPDPVWS